MKEIILTDADLIYPEYLGQLIQNVRLSHFYLNQNIINRANIIVYVRNNEESKVLKYKIV